ncbi:MAG TPA: 3'-5' exonuclease, partial [Candidatus Andersenbacteria bacterium]|nr:3'-5' exonuclease [Candidatus Andersenbacteria bacterium]
MPQRTALPETVVGIDVETTSLDPAAGEIIEVSAIKYHLGEEVQIAEFTRLCRPRAPLAAQITAITGITNEMVGQSPAFADLRDELQEFIGESLLFAHNASFDIGFLTYHGLKIEVNPVWDTFMLASVAWPEAESYNLGLLAAQLGIVVAGEHRAGDDVRLTWQLLEKIREQLATSPETHQHITEVLVKSSQEQYLALFTTTPATPTTPSIPLTTSPGLAAARPPSPP